MSVAGSLACLVLVRHVWADGFGRPPREEENFVDDNLLKMNLSVEAARRDKPLCKTIAEARSAL